MKDLAVQVPIIGQQKNKIPAALFRVRREGTEVLYCGPNPNDAVSTFYALELNDPTVIVEGTGLTSALQGKPEWEQLLPRVEETTLGPLDLCKSAVVVSE